MLEAIEDQAVFMVGRLAIFMYKRVSNSHMEFKTDQIDENLPWIIPKLSLFKLF
jgi:hypothetical protein